MPTAIYPADMTPALEQVLGMPNFELHPIWMALREVGVQIPSRYENEQAAALHFLVPLALRHPNGEHPDGWQTAAAEELRRLKDGRPLPFEHFSASADFVEGAVAVTLYSSIDPGPMREFVPIGTVKLDEAHATELLGTLMIALDKLRSGPRS